MIFGPNHLSGLRRSLKEHARINGSQVQLSEGDAVLFRARSDTRLRRTASGLVRWVFAAKIQLTRHLVVPYGSHHDWS